MTNKKCPNCQGLGWVCENHMNKPWDEGIEGGCECGAGTNCICNPNGNDDGIFVEIYAEIS